MRNIDLQELFRAALPSVDRDPLALLPKSLYRLVWKVSGPQQVRLCLLTRLLFPLAIVPLELQPRIVNSVLAKVDITVLVDLGAVYLAVLLFAPGCKSVNRYGKQRAELLRELSQGVVVDEGHGEEKRADGFKDLIGSIYTVRIRLYAVKFFAKFLNNFMGHLGVLSSFGCAVRAWRLILARCHAPSKVQNG